MTGPDPAPRPSVTTAPAEGGASGASSPLGRRRLPAHLGPARTSTVLLAVAFLAVGVLYLFVKPPEPRTAGVGTDPATTTAPDAPTTTAPPAPTSAEPEPTPEETPVPTSEAAPTTTEAPEEVPVEPTEVPTTTQEESAPAPTTSEPLPTTAAPTS